MLKLFNSLQDKLIVKGLNSLYDNLILKGLNTLQDNSLLNNLILKGLNSLQNKWIVKRDKFTTGQSNTERINVQRTAHLCKVIGVGAQYVFDPSRLLVQFLHRSHVLRYVTLFFLHTIESLGEVIGQPQLELWSAESTVEPETDRSSVRRTEDVRYKYKYTITLVHNNTSDAVGSV